MKPMMGTLLRTALVGVLFATTGCATLVKGTTQGVNVMTDPPGAACDLVRDGKAMLDDLRGGTFTITNIGALGGTGAIPIINYPEVAILGVARGREEPVVRGGQIVVRTMLPLTLTFDHRVADGADGARFAQAIIRRLEAPETLFVGW